MFFLGYARGHVKFVHTIAMRKKYDTFVTPTAIIAPAAAATTTTTAVLASDIVTAISNNESEKNAVNKI